MNQPLNIQLHPDWRHEKPAAYAMFIPQGIRINDWDDYAVFLEWSDAASFRDQLADAIADQCDREPTEEELTIYHLHAISK